MNILKTSIVVITSIAITSIFVKAIDKNQENKNLDACPSEMVFVSSPTGGFCIDQYEASASRDCSFLDPDNQDKTRVNLSDTDCHPVSVKDAMPWRFISQDQAREACARAGKRLATNKEWVLASRGTIDLDDNWTEADCNVDNNWAENPGLTGSGEKCISGVGAYDMIGNVWEWVDDTILDGKINELKLPTSGFVAEVNEDSIPVSTDQVNPDFDYGGDYLWMKDSELRGMARGGYWNNGSRAGKFAVYAEVNPSFVGVGIGFRCVK